MAGIDPLNLSTNSVTGAYSLTGSDYVLFYDPTAGGYAVTLPDATKNRGRVYMLVQTTSAVGTVTIKATVGNVNQVAGSTGVTINAQRVGVIWAVSNGTDWFIGAGTAVMTATA